MSTDKWVLLSQEHCREDQCSSKVGPPRPPAWEGVKIISFLYLFLLPFMNLQMVCSISLVMLGLGRGRMVAMCVILESRQALVMLTLAVVSLMDDQTPI